MSSSNQQFNDWQVFHIKTEDDQARLWNMVKTDAGLSDFQKVRKLVLYLNSRQIVLQAEDKLAMALNRLHPTRSGKQVTNNHRLTTIVFLVQGEFLFTRFRYTLSAPTEAHPSGERRNELLSGRLTPDQKKIIAFEISSREKAIAAALLGLRGIPNVHFDTEPKGVGEPRTTRFEGGFREMLELALVCSPALVGNIPAASAQTKKPFATPELDWESTFQSVAYDRTSTNPYDPDNALDVTNIDVEDGILNLYNMVPINPLRAQDQWGEIDSAAIQGSAVMPLQVGVDEVCFGWKV